jgi:hypothetical protein
MANTCRRQRQRQRQRRTQDAGLSASADSGAALEYCVLQIGKRLFAKNVQAAAADGQ